MSTTIKTCLLALFGLAFSLSAGCGGGGADTSAGGESGIALPAGIDFDNLPADGTPTARVRVDAGGWTNMQVDTVARTVTAEVRAGVGAHTFMVEFRFRDPDFGDVLLVSGTRNLTVVTGQNNLGFVETDYSYVDEDGDGLANVTEVEIRTDPTTSADTNACAPAGASLTLSGGASGVTGTSFTPTSVYFDASINSNIWDIDVRVNPDLTWARLGLVMNTSGEVIGAVYGDVGLSNVAVRTCTSGPCPGITFDDVAQQAVFTDFSMSTDDGVLLFNGTLPLPGGCDAQEPIVDPIGDVSGTWAISEETTSATGVCAGEVGTVFDYNVDVTQSGNDLTVSTPGGTYTGLISGDQIEWTGSYPDDGGTTTITSMDLTLASDCNSLSGSTTWSWTDGVSSCTGTTDVTGTRASPVGCGGGTAFTESEPNNGTVGTDDTLHADSNVVTPPIVITGAVTYERAGLPTAVESEPNDAVDSANDVSSPLEVSGTASWDGAAGDTEDYYAFTPTATGDYWITLDGMDAPDLDLYLVSSNETVLAASVFGGTSTEYLRYNLQAGTTYYIVVSVFTGGTNATVPYNLRIQQGADQFDYFRFIPTQTVTYTVTLSNFGTTADLDLWGFAWDADEDYSALNEGNPVETFTYTFNAGTEYYIVVDAWETGGVSTPYTLTIEP